MELTMELTPFHYRAWGGTGEDVRHILVWGRLADAKPLQTSMREFSHNGGPPPIKVPVIGSGKLAWVSPNRLTLLEGGSGCQPPQEWLETYKKGIVV